MYRTEKDIIGEKKLPSDALYGIHALRARENFPDEHPFPSEWYKALGITKLACYRTYRKFRTAAEQKLGSDLPVSYIDDNSLDALMSAALEVSRGDHYDQFIVPALQGGAGTSINMNINEIICNRALQKLGNKCGEYTYIDPLLHANIFQSTNDVVPSSLTVAVIGLLNELENEINSLRSELEKLEKQHRDKLRPGYTQLQEAVPASFGSMFGAYNEALSRDWWRVSKCFERIRQVNLGGGATGSGIAIPRFFIMEVVQELRDLTNMQISRSENLPDTTSNLDRWVEIHATLKAHAVNLEKMASDIRLMASDIAGKKLLSIPEKQAGSSIMPGKINPVIPEFVISCSHKVYANDALISSLCGQGAFELNPYLPLIGTTLIETIKLLIAADQTFLQNLLKELKVNDEQAYKSLIFSPSVVTALVPYTGYHKAGELARLMREKGIDVFSANSIMKIIDEEKLNRALEPGNLMKLGFSIDDLITS
jgi:aspartate ammonia-lyase